MERDTLRIEDYGLIGNLETCALVGKNGSVDWLCLPSLESPSVFAALLDPERGGRCIVTPRARFASLQRYLPGTNILVTHFETASGQAALTDFMPVVTAPARPAALLRKLECRRGWMEFCVRFAPRFDYARRRAELRPTAQGVEARAGEEALHLGTDIALAVEGDAAQAFFRLETGRPVWFQVQYGQAALPPLDQAQSRLEETRRFWEAWMEAPCDGDCRIEERWLALTRRSGLVLKLLTASVSGAVAAAPTTSLPEEIGGSRNWDYRFAWIRDSSFTAQALYHLGHRDEVLGFRRWIEKIVKTETPDSLKVLYPRLDAVDTRERTLDNLAGYEGSKPVRVGNNATRQNQIDIHGELVSAIYETARYGHDVDPELWEALRGLVDHVERAWQDKDAGMWEVRVAPSHHVSSKLMCWVALDRALRIVQEKGFAAPVERWRATAAAIRRAILERGFNARLGSFVQSFDAEDLDASSLLIPLLGFLPPTDERVRGTIKAVMDRLMVADGLVLRYDNDDGLTGREGAFAACGFWLVQALALGGQVDRAEEIFERLVGHASPLGLFSEEIHRENGRLLGNYPQAFSHVGCINAALYLATAKGIRVRQPLPMGVAG